jgi:hypothetical protein
LLSAKKIAAGKGARIEVKIKTANLSGTVEKLIHVTTNDPRSPDVRLTVRAIVEPEISLSEYGIIFGTIPQGQEARREILLTVHTPKKIRILGAETTDPRVSVRIEPVPGSQPPQWKLTAIRKAGGKVGDHYGEIAVKTDSAYVPRISIYERGTVSAPRK